MVAVSVHTLGASWTRASNNFFLKSWYLHAGKEIESAQEKGWKVLLMGSSATVASMEAGQRGESS